MKLSKIDYIFISLIIGLIIFFPLYLIGVFIGWSDNCEYLQRTCDIWNIIAYFSLSILIIGLFISITISSYLCIKYD
jgi:hypothetical protein